ncbi:hypothetical protein ACFLX0_01140 [Chloroflexota bacterium]
MTFVVGWRWKYRRTLTIEYEQSSDPVSSTGQALNACPAQNKGGINEFKRNIAPGNGNGRPQGHVAEAITKTEKPKRKQSKTKEPVAVA